MTATAVPLWNVAAFGWVCVGRQQHGDTTVDTWTAGHDVLVLVWQGEANVVAAVLNGESVELGDLMLVIGAESADDLEQMLERAEHHVREALPDRVGTELGKLFHSAQRTLNAQSSAPGGPAPFTLHMRAALHNLALAVLSTPGG
jgi:hypothetical protein